MNRDADVITITRSRLDDFPLPVASDDDDKDSRGVVLVIGGSARVPGAIKLSGVAALKAGAGKLQIGTVKAAAIPLGIAVPEALVVSLPMTREGEIGRTAGTLLAERVAGANSVLIGPGVSNQQAIAALIRGVLSHLPASATLILDGAATVSLRANDSLLHALASRAVLTPHAGEMASLLEVPIEEVRADPANIAQHCADRFRAVTVLKGGETWIAQPNETIMHFRDGKVGLGTSGSGDVLAGIIAGLAARGALPRTAAAWGVWVHGSAGNNLSHTVGRTGFLAREILDEIPALVNE
ncbi:MAG: NAD(P)H-hydrate dehydratase [Phycisphaerae bacterium]|nr:NAD(P)H-hydrate dehydratase [Gemmatimonadaceae bacterium]